MDDEETPAAKGSAEQREREREKVDREADLWRKEGGLLREEVNISRLEESPHLIGMASEWLELDASDEGIRFDSELVSCSLSVMSASAGRRLGAHYLALRPAPELRLRNRHFEQN